MIGTIFCEATMSIKISLNVPNQWIGVHRETMTLRGAIRSFTNRSGHEGDRDLAIAHALGKLTELVLEHIDDQKVKMEFLTHLLPDDAKIEEL